MTECVWVPIRGRKTYHPFGVIQWIIDDSHLGSQVLCHDGFAFVVLVVSGELQLMDGMTEIVSDAFFLQVRYQVVNVFIGRCLEGTTGREMNIACNFINTKATRDIATLVRLLLQFFCPTFFDALVPQPRSNTHR